MSEKKLSKLSHNEDGKKDYEAVEMLKIEDHDNNSIEKDQVSSKDSKNQVTLRWVLQLTLWIPKMEL